MSTSSDLQRAIVDALPEALLLVDIRGRLLLSNQAFKRLLGYVDEDLENMRILDLDIELSMKGFKGLIAKLESQSEFHSKSTFLSKTHEEIELEYLVQNILYGDSTHLLYKLDTNKVAAAETDQRTSKLSDIFLSSHDAVIILNGSTQTIIAANDPAHEFLGQYSIEGTALSSYIAGSQDDLDLFLDHVMDNKVGQSGELHFRNHEGVGIPTEVNATYYQDKGKEGIVLLLRPISSQRQIEGTLTRIVEKALSKSKMEFIPAFVEEMANVLGVKCIGLTQAVEDAEDELQIVSLWYDGRFEKNYQYHIKNTPSEKVLRDGSFHVERGISDMFSEDTFLTRMRAESYLGIPVVSSGGQIKGHFFIIDDKPLYKQPWIEVLLQIAANRLALELERKEVEDELKQRMEMEALVSEISTELITTTDKNLDERVEWLLKKVGQHVGVDRTYIFKLTDDRKAGSITNEWTRDDIIPLKNDFQQMRASDHPWPFETLMAKRMLLIHDINEQKGDLKGFEKVFYQHHITSMLNMPLVLSEKVYGFLGFNTEKKHPWNIKDIVLLKLVSEVLISTISRVDYEANLKQINDKLEEEVAIRTKDLEAALMEVNELTNKLEAENTYLKEEYNLSLPFDHIISQDPKFKQVLAQAKQVADTPTTVLILGETGTGKEVISQFIHDMSDRKNESLIKINCAALPATLIESELFGHEKGAFTGATSGKKGRFELADGGTLFLDEIGEVPIELQPKLLRAIQEGEFERLGGTKPIRVDVRLVAATNRNLQDEVKKGNFRADLYYRLNVFPIQIPPLRERKKDIKPLVNYFMQINGQKLGKKIKKVPVSVIEQLENYHWPGNVRELENIIERAVIVSPESHLILGNWLQSEKSDAHNNSKKFTSFEDMERRYLTEVLEHTNWKVSGTNGAAEILKIKPTTLDSRLKKLGITKQK